MKKSPYGNVKRPSLFHLFISFLRLGITAFGGPAMVAYIRRMVVEKKKWLDDATFQDGVALCQTVPGATSMQTCAYVGLKLRRVAGAAVSFIGFGLPAFLIMMVLSALYSNVYGLPTVVSAFNGLQILVVAIVANAVVLFGRVSLKKWSNVGIAAMAAAMFVFGVNPITVILLAAFLGILFYHKLPTSHPTVTSVRGPSFTRPLLYLLSITAMGFVLLYLIQPKLFDLAALMFRIDLFAFGGGFASVPLMFHEIVDARSWLDAQTFLSGIALGQITPGPIVITATFVGYLLYGPVGGIIATISIFLPSFLIIVGITQYFDRLRGSPYFNSAIRGILCSFVGLLLSVTIRFALNITWDPLRILFVSLAFAALYLKVELLLVILIGTVVSILIL